MTEKKQLPHAHMQIQYEDCESLVGFNPNHTSDRKLAHEMLDEYLDYLCQEQAKLIASGESETKDVWYSEDSQPTFCVGAFLDTH